MANPASDTAIISVGLRYQTDIGACFIYIDDIRLDKIRCLEVYDKYILCGLTTGKYYWSLTGASGGWTQSTMDNAIAHLFCVAPPFSGTKDLIVLAKTPNEVRTSIAPASAVPILRETAVGFTSGVAIYGANWRSQTFTPASSHTIGKVVIPLQRTGSPGTITASIRATSSGHPIGPDLCSGSVDGATIPTGSYSPWTTINMDSGYFLTTGVKYAIVVRAPSGTVANYVDWYYVTPTSYAGGNLEYSIDSGAAWTSKADQDHAFEEWSIAIVGASWTDPPYYIGDTTTDIVSLFVLGGTLFIGKEDGLYALPVDGRPVALTPEFKDKRDSTNFKYHTNWQGIFYGSLAGDIVELINSGSELVINYMGPLERSPELAITGSVIGITRDDKNLYATLYVNSYNIIYTGRERYDDKYGLRWEWVPYIHIGINDCGAIKVMQRTGANPKLWFAYGNNVANAILSRSPNYRFCPQGYLITSYFDCGYDTWQKVLYQLWTISRSLDTTHQYIKIYYQKDTDVNWSSVLATITANGVQSIDLTVLSCKKIRLKIELNTDDSTKTPVLTGFMYRGVLQPELTRTLDFTVVLGQSPSRKPSTDLAFLETGRTATSPISFKDLRFGTTRYLMFLPNSPMEGEAMHEAGKQPTYQARIIAQQLNYTPP